MALKDYLEYDIVVIGAGPAGIAGALYSSQKGKKTLLISNESNKSLSGHDCIESIHPGIVSLFSQLKIDTDISASIKGSYTCIDNGKTKYSLNPYGDELWAGFHVSKRSFIDHLMKCATLQNIEVIPDDTVSNIILENNRLVGIILRSGKAIRSKYIIDATGNKRFLGKRLGFQQRYYSPALFAYTGVSKNVEINIDDSQTAYFLPNQHGWTWVAKLNNNSFYWTKLTTNEFAKKLLIENADTQKSANVRWRSFRPLCIEGGILCGDAACLIDPAAGQGILNAMTSGIKAAQSAVECLNNSHFENIILANYDNFIFNTFEQNIIKLTKYYKMQNIHIL